MYFKIKIILKNNYNYKQLIVRSNILKKYKN
jgi:hypothetical protein